MSTPVCSLCQTPTPNLVVLDPGIKKAIESSGIARPAPAEICGSCFKNWKQKVSAGAKVVAAKEAHNDLATDLWRNRLQFVKEARNYFNKNLFPEAAASYEKYLKVLEVAFNDSLAQLTPSHFVEKPKEVGLLCSVFWDLMLIYDHHPTLYDKQILFSKKLSEFCKYSKVYSNLIRRAEIEYRKANNPDAFRLFLESCDVSVGRCFVANAVFDKDDQKTILQLCAFRDQVLNRKRAGRAFVAFYYRYSPHWALWLSRSPAFKTPIRCVLRRVGHWVHRIFNLQPKPEELH